MSLCEASIERLGKKCVKRGAQHANVIGHGLQLAVTAFFTSRASVVALDEQHLQQRAPFIEDFLGAVVHIHALGCFQRAGRGVPAVHADDAYTATAMRWEVRVVAQVRDVLAGSQRGVHDGLAILEGDVLAVQLECFFCAQFPNLRWASSSSRPVRCLETSRALSRLKEGSWLLFTRRLA